MSVEVEHLLKQCGLEKFYPRFMKAGLRSTHDLQRRSGLVPALLPQPRDVNLLFREMERRGIKPTLPARPSSAAPGEGGAASSTRRAATTQNTSRASNFSDPTGGVGNASASHQSTTTAGGGGGLDFEEVEDEDDLVLNELLSWQKLLRTQLRESANTCAHSMIETSSAFKRDRHPVGPRAAKLLVAKEQERVEHNKTMLAVCNSGLKAHRQHMELSKMRQTGYNRGGDPTALNNLTTELDGLSGYVQDVLVTLAEEKKGLRKPFFETEKKEEEETKAAETQQQVSQAALEALRTILKEKEEAIDALEQKLVDETRAMQLEIVRGADSKESLQSQVETLQHNVNSLLASEETWKLCSQKQDDVSSLLLVEQEWQSTRSEVQMSCFFERCALLHQFTVAREIIVKAKETELQQTVEELTTNLRHELIKVEEGIETAQKNEEAHSVTLSQQAITYEGKLEQMRDAYEKALERHQQATLVFEEKEKQVLEAHEINTKSFQDTIATLEDRLDEKDQEIASVKSSLATMTNNWRSEESLHLKFEAIVTKEKLAAACQTLTPRTLRKELLEHGISPSGDKAGGKGESLPVWLLPSDIVVEPSEMDCLYKELIPVLLDKGFDDKYAVRHAVRLYSVEKIARDCAEGLPTACADQSGALACADTIRDQVSMIVSRHQTELSLEEEKQQKRQDDDAESPKIATPSASPKKAKQKKVHIRQEEEDEGVTEDDEEEAPPPAVSIGLPLLDTFFASSWRLLEHVVGHHMPRTDAEALRLAEHDGLREPQTLHEELMETFYETMRVTRALRAELFCTPVKKERPRLLTDEEIASISKDDPEARSPVTLKGRRRQ